MKLIRGSLASAMLGSLILLVLCPLGALCDSSDSGIEIEATLKDDAYHYFPNGINDEIFAEWWYFNGVSDDVQFLFSYFLIDPDNASGMRKIQVLAVVLEDLPLICLYNGEEFTASHDRPYVAIDGREMFALDNTTYQVMGSCPDTMTGSPIVWNLTYESLAAPSFGMPVPIHVGHINGSWMQWLSYMPSAKVTGTIRFGNISRDVDAIGYHDHNWGRWLFNDPQWNWAQVSTPEDEFSLTLGDVIGSERNTNISVKYEGESIIFGQEGQAVINYDEFAFDQTTASVYPTTYKVSAENGKYGLKMRIDVLKNVPLFVSYPEPLPSYMIFEQVSAFDGKLSDENGTIYQFEQMGFSEYTTHQLHTIYGMVTAPDPRNTTVVATNLRTGQRKSAHLSSEGYFSLDANFEDYLNDSTAPWVMNGDKIILKAQDLSRRENATSLVVDMSTDRQEATIVLV